MKKVVLLLDQSEAMNDQSDMNPSRLLALSDPVMNLVETFLKGSPLSVISPVAMRDGVAKQLTPLTSDCQHVINTLEKQYFLFGGSGHVSLQNGLSVAMSELTARKRYDRQPGEIILISGSLSTVDPGSLNETINLAQERKIRCHALGLNGASHVLQQLTMKTGGTFLCPMSRGQVPALVGELLSCLDGPKRNQNNKGESQRGKRGREDGGDEQASSVLIGLPRKTISAAADRAEEEDLLPSCPQCYSPLPSRATPTTCNICCLLITEESKLMVSALQQATPELLDTSSIVTAAAIKKKDTTTPGGNASSSTTTCFGCSSRVMVGASSTSLTSGNSFSCPWCKEIFCRGCRDTIEKQLSVCPGCF